MQDAQSLLKYEIEKVKIILELLEKNFQRDRYFKGSSYVFVDNIFEFNAPELIVMMTEDGSLMPDNIKDPYIDFLNILKEKIEKLIDAPNTVDYYKNNPQLCKELSIFFKNLRLHPGGINFNITGYAVLVIDKFSNDIKPNEISKCWTGQLLNKWFMLEDLYEFSQQLRSLEEEREKYIENLFNKNV